MAKDYSKPNTKAWREVCDDLFLARFRGLPCAICGAKSKVYNGRKTRSCFHHLLEKDLHRVHRYEPYLGVILCPEHHGRHAREMSPHSDDTFAVMSFYKWLFDEWGAGHISEILISGKDKWEGTWTYKEKYVELGGEILSKTGFIKDDRPLNHSTKVKALEAENV